MNRRITSVLACAAGVALASAPAWAAKPAPRSFGAEVAFLKKHTAVVVLGGNGSARVAIAPAYQGRVMTSTAGGNRGLSYGWVNNALVASGKFIKHMNTFGGEDRVWVGPEGGQFGLFFKKGVPFDLAHWYTPAGIDTLPYPVAAAGRDWARFRKTIAVTNHSGTHFRIGLIRTIRLLKPAAVWRRLGIAPQRGVRMVAYDSESRMINRGRVPWKKSTGLISLWVIGQFNPGPHATIIIPFKPNVRPGPVVNDAYFGKVPADRLKVEDGVLFFKADGMYRSKIGIAPRRAKPILGSYDADSHVLTLVQFWPLVPHAGYVNSMWEIQKRPYGGDVVNSYNDGPPSPGARPLGPFYELETSSPAEALRPGHSAMHTHRTIHIQGSEAELDRIARATLGVSLAQVKSAFAGG